MWATKAVHCSVINVNSINSVNNVSWYFFFSALNRGGGELCPSWVRRSPRTRWSVAVGWVLLILVSNTQISDTGVIHLVATFHRHLPSWTPCSRFPAWNIRDKKIRTNHVLAMKSITVVQNMKIQNAKVVWSYLEFALKVSAVMEG